MFSDPVLFSEHPIDNYLAGLTRTAVAGIERLRSGDVLDSAGEPSERSIADHVAATVADHLIEPVVLLIKDTERTELTVEDGVMATSVIIPFEGDVRLFGLDANYTAPFSDPVRATVAYTDGDSGDGPDHQLVFWVRSPRLDVEFESLLQNRTQALQSHLEWINSLAIRWNESLHGEVERAVRARAELLHRMSRGDAAISIPIRRRSEPTISMPLERRELPLRPQATDLSPGERASSTWSLDEATYEEVLRLLELYAAAAGRLPEDVGRLGENQLRNFALLVLNANFYVQSAHGEVFNGRGKTDLLVPRDGQNVFVGELKRYDGPGSVTKALDQLLGYLTWADDKAAYLPIIDRSDVTDALRKIDDAIMAHANCVGSLPERRLETSPRDARPALDRRRDYVFKSTTDPARRVSLAVIPIVVATPPEEAVRH